MDRRRNYGNRYYNNNDYYYDNQYYYQGGYSNYYDNRAGYNKGYRKYQNKGYNRYYDNKQFPTVKVVEISSEPQNDIKETQPVGNSTVKKIEEEKHVEYHQESIEEIREYLQELSVKVDIEKMKAYCEADKDNIKLISKENPINTSTMLLDISMNPKGIDEEKAYMAHPEYTTIIRRGNTILEEYIPQGNSFKYKKAYMLRKGMKKFIDLPFDFFGIDPKTNKYYLKTSNLENKEKANSLKYIFYPCIDANNRGYLIEIIKLMKANGENAQISYSPLLNSWVIASKNVCLCARKRSDLDTYYPKRRYDKETRSEVATRYSFANIIGHCWFDIIENFSEGHINAIKNYIKDKTLIGEYVGNQYHQHLIRYMKHTILFFGIVDNENPIDNSLPIIKAFAKLKEFKLDVVPYEYIGTYEKMEDVYEAMKKLYIRIAESSIIDEEEGSVIYLNRTRARSIKSDMKYRIDDKVLSLCKLKTWEYRIYRKLREKLKNHLNDQNYYEDSRRKISQFFEETRSMLQGFNLPMPIEFYYKVAETAFDFANYYKDRGVLPDLHSTYIDFIETIHSIVDESVNLKSRVIQLDNIMTYDYLIKNTLKAKKIVEIIIYAPPCYLSEDFLKEIAQTFSTDIHNAFISEDNYININNDVLIYHINMHNFRNISKLGKNKFIISFGLNEEEIEKSKGILKEKMKNALFKSYNTNKSLLPFIESDNLDKLYQYYTNESIKFISKAKANFPNQVKVYKEYIRSRSELYIGEIEGIVDSIKKDIKDINEEQIVKDSFYSDNKTLISIDTQSTEKRKKESKYKNDKYINIYEEHINPYESLKQEFLENQKKKYTSSNSVSNEIEQSYSNVKQIIVLIPMTIPGNGKTYFINQLKPILEKYNIVYRDISSDLIRRRVMDGMMARNRRITEQEAFAKSGKTANFKFEDELQETFKSLYYDTKVKKAMIYIDKNHPTNAINRSTEPIRKFLKDNFDSSFKLDLKFVALIPDCVNNFEFAKNNSINSIPFSLSYFIQCYLRVKHRNDHPTLNGNSKNLISIFGMFIQNFINLKLNENSIILYQKLDKAIKLPFTDEVEEDQLPPDLVKCAREFFVTLVSNDKGGYSYNNNIQTPIAERFEYMINKYFPKGNEFFPTKNLVSSTVEPIVAKIYHINTTEIIKTQNFVYLGVLLTGEKCYVKIRAKLANALKSIKENCMCAVTKEIEDLISMIQIVKGLALPEGWKYPHRMHKNLWHCTTLYKGNVDFSKVKNRQEYNEFEEGKIVNVKVVGIVYVPMKIIVTVVKLENTKSINEYTHITTFINGYAPKKANDVMKEIFSSKSTTANIYKAKMTESNEENEITTSSNKDYVSEESISIDGENVKAYVVLYGSPFILEGSMHAFEK